MAFFKIRVAAQELGLHPNTVRSLDKRGIIHVSRDYNGHRIFTTKDLREIKKVLFPESEK